MAQFDCFSWAHQRSSTRYASIYQVSTDPNPFRLRYRQKIFSCIHEIVTLCLNSEDALKTVAQHAELHFSPQDHNHFFQLIKKELSTIHEGNIARHQISPLQYKKWKKLIQD